jgi:hypothetical protein
MRSLTFLCIVLMISAFAAGQVVVVGGTATTAPAYGVYGAPFVPRVSTPMVSLSSTASGVYTQPVLYNPETPAVVFVQPAAPSGGQAANHSGFGVAGFPDNASAKSLMTAKGSWQKASRTYTNQDVDRVSQSTNTVKYEGKTEEIK